MSDPQQPQIPPYTSGPTQPPLPPQQPHAQPVYAQPAQQQQGYAQPAQQGYAQPAYAAPGAANPTGTNPMGRIGLIFGIVSVGLQVLLNAMIQIMIRSGSYQMISFLSGIFSVIIFLAAVGAIVFGLIGIRRVGAPHAVAGIATGLGIAVVVGSGLNFIFNALSTF